MFLNCHLQSGVDKGETRVKDLNKIFDEVFKKHEKKGVSKITDGDFVFVFGDLNFRIDM